LAEGQKCNLKEPAKPLCLAAVTGMEEAFMICTPDETGSAKVDVRLIDSFKQAKKHWAPKEIIMKLMPKSLAKNIPLLGETEGQGRNAIVHVKLFTPDANFTWYITEHNPETGECFGLVVGMETELGYISLPELESVKGPMGLPIERDLHFDPQPLCEVSGLELPGWMT
jgi:hypothetical protein